MKLPRKLRNVPNLGMAFRSHADNAAYYLAQMARMVRANASIEEQRDADALGDAFESTGAELSEGTKRALQN